MLDHIASIIFLAGSCFLLSTIIESLFDLRDYSRLKKTIKK